MTAEPEPLVVDRAGLQRMLKIRRRESYLLEDAGLLPAPLILGIGKKRQCKRWSIEELREWVRAGGPPRREWENLRSVASAPRTGEAGLH